MKFVQKMKCMKKWKKNLGYNGKVSRFYFLEKWVIFLGTGYSNKEFTQPPVLRPARLSEWELFRAIQPDRNFYYPKGRAFLNKNKYNILEISYFFNYK